MNHIEYMLKMERNAIDLFKKYKNIDYKKEYDNLVYDKVLYEVKKKQIKYVLNMEDTINIMMKEIRCLIEHLIIRRENF